MLGTERAGLARTLAARSTIVASGSDRVSLADDPIGSTENYAAQ